jgi:hypothetical protein
MAQIFLIGGLFRWNLTQNVGRNQPNVLDDVELVRFGYACMARNTRFPPKGALPDVLAQMSSTGGYDDDLQSVIDAHEKSRGGTQDGCVSVDRSTQINKGVYDAAHHNWIIGALNNNMRDVVGDIYPRIDKSDFSGPGISAVVKKLLIPNS